MRQGPHILIGFPLISLTFTPHVIFCTFDFPKIFPTFNQFVKNSNHWARNTATYTEFPEQGSTIFLKPKSQTSPCHLITQSVPPKEMINHEAVALLIFNIPKLSQLSFS